jgi:hypothetical protein
VTNSGLICPYGIVVVSRLQTFTFNRTPSDSKRANGEAHPFPISDVTYPSHRRGEQNRKELPACRHGRLWNGDATRIFLTRTAAFVLAGLPDEHALKL